MSKRKKILIDKKFQLRTVYALLGVKIIIVAMLLSIVGVYALYQNKKISNIVEIEDNIVQVLSLPVAPPTSEETTETQEKTNEEMQKISLQMAQNHDQNMKQLRRMINLSQALIWIIIAVIFIQGFILFFVLIKQTHRIAGPLYVMSMYMRSIINGTFPEHLRPLRDRDMLKDFYKLFSEMVESLKQRYGSDS